jgi:predicted nucleic acid-binding protein
MLVVSDTSPISGLLAIDKVFLLKQLYDIVIIPPAVKEELFKIQSKKKELESLFSNDWMQVRQITDLEFYNELKKNLDEGESQAIALAREIHADIILIDEAKGRNVATKAGLNVIGLLGVLIDAKSHNFIPSVKPLLDELIQQYGIWIKPELYSTVLASINEI